MKLINYNIIKSGWIIPLVFLILSFLMFLGSSLDITYLIGGFADEGEVGELKRISKKIILNLLYYNIIESLIFFALVLILILKKKG